MKLIVGDKQIADRVITADCFKARLKGLVGQKGMPPGYALIIQPCNSIHTWFMQFNIDVLFIGEADRVVKTVDYMPPFRIATVKVAAYVVELPAGTVKKYDVKPGDLVKTPRLQI